jgi:hypothetical protein
LSSSSSNLNVSFFVQHKASERERGTAVSLYCSGFSRALQGQGHGMINTQQDNTFSSGQIAVVAENVNSPTEVVFRNARVWQF